MGLSINLRIIITRIKASVSGSLWKNRCVIVKYCPARLSGYEIVPWILMVLPRAERRKVNEV